MCSGCRGHHAEGKLGPALADDYWTYPKNKTDKGLFETTSGGARAMMGPMYKQLSVDEMLMVVSWIRAIYRGPVENADWLTEEQKKTFKPRPFSDEGAAMNTAETAKSPAESSDARRHGIPIAHGLPGREEVTLQPECEHNNLM